MKKSLALLLLLVVLPSFALAQPVFTGKPQYNIRVMRADTLMGNIVVELFPAIAPMAVENFDSLVRIKFYDSTAFHRVIPGFMIQGGDPNSRSGDTSTWGFGDPEQTTVDAEFNAVSHLRGILSAARAQDINSATSQFFICVGNAAYLDHNYTAYGHVVSGMRVADSVVNAPRNHAQNDRPYTKISMFITYLGSNDSIPAAPLPIFPGNNAHVTATLETLRWSKVPNTMIYHLEIASDTGFNTLVIDTELNQIDTSAKVKLANNAIYYWRVTGNNGGHLSTPSTTSAFTLGSLGLVGSAVSSDNVRVFPNPASRESQVEFNIATRCTVTLVLRDELGREVMRSTGVLSSGEHRLPIDLSRLPAGSYRYSLNADGRVFVGNVIVE